MKKILFVLLLFVSYLSYGQGSWSLTASKTRFGNGFGLSSKDTSVFTNGSDTLLMQFGRDSIVYVKWKGYWKPLAYSADTSSLTNRFVRNQTGNLYQQTGKFWVSDTGRSGSLFYAPKFIGNSFQALGSGGGDILNNSGSTVAQFGVGGGTNFDFHGFAGYNANRSSSYTDRSFTDLKFVDSSTIHNQINQSLSAQTAKFYVTDTVRTNSVVWGNKVIASTFGNTGGAIGVLGQWRFSNNEGIYTINVAGNTFSRALYQDNSDTIRIGNTTTPTILNGIGFARGSNRIALPNASGTLALTSDIPVSGTFTNRRIPFANSSGQLKDTTGFTWAAETLSVPGAINAINVTFSGIANIGSSSTPSSHNIYAQLPYVNVTNTGAVVVINQGSTGHIIDFLQSSLIKSYIGNDGSFNGPGTGLTGIASGLSIGGTAGSETLATVTGRGASTSTAVSFNGGLSSTTGKFSGVIYGADGASNSASIRFYNSNTGLYYPGSDALGIVTGATEKIRITSSGSVLINTTTDDGSNKLQVNGGISGYRVVMNNSTQTQGEFWGWSSIQGVSAATGEIRLGGTSLLQGRLIYSSASSTALYIENTFDDANAEIKLRTRVSGTPVNALTVTAGAATFSGTVTASSFSGAGTGLTGTASGLSIGGSSANSSALNGYTQSADGTANTVALRNASGDIVTRLFRTEYASGGGTGAYFLVQNAIGAGADNYARPMPLADVKTALGLGSYAYRSSGLAELTGASFTGNISTTGTITASGGGFNSDLTLKKIIAINPQTDIADKVTLIKHEWINKKSYGDGEYYGYGAQWIQSILPEAVYTNESTGKLAVNYTMVHSVILNEHTREINELKSEIITLKKMLNEIRN